MLGSASPRKPKLAIVLSSSNRRSLLVACRSTHIETSSGDMPWPLSRTLSSSTPPPATLTSQRVASASNAFSSSSLRALAGRSTTSPAAIWLANVGGSTAMRPIVASVFPRWRDRCQKFARCATRDRDNCERQCHQMQHEAKPKSPTEQLRTGLLVEFRSFDDSRGGHQSVDQVPTNWFAQPIAEAGNHSTHAQNLNEKLERQPPPK